MGTRGGVAAGLVACLLLTSCAEGSTREDDPADVELYVQLALDSAWTPSPGSNTRPPPGSVRFALPNGWGQWMQRCMIQSGYDNFDFSRTGGFSNDGQPAKHDGVEGLAWYYCTQQLPWYDTVFTQLTNAELDELYDYYERWLVPCLASHGGGVVELRGRAEFVDGGDGQPGWWNPYLDSVRPASVAAIAAQFWDCPPYLPSRAVDP